MDRYKDNAKWLIYFAPFKAMSVSAAYLTPFFLQKGLSLSQIFVLQSIFSVAFLVWELPSGLIADRLGRAFSIKLSAPIAASAMVAYGLSNQYWQFVVCELVLALAKRSLCA
jgi:MFS family permease